MKHNSWFVLSTLALCGCTPILNPCPRGTEPDRVQGRCVPIVDRDRSDAKDDASVPDLDGGQSVDGGHDGSSADQEASVDGGGFAEAGPCGEHDIEAWRNFHVNDGAVATMTTCIEQECGDAGTCYPAACIRDAIGLIACEGCIDEESACVLEFCNSACGWPGSDAECRACTCESGCVSRFDDCAKVTLGVCENVHGRDAKPNEPPLQGPWLLRMKGSTGFLQVGPLEPTPPTWSGPYSSVHLSEGFTHAVPFTARGRSYLLQHKSQCGNDPCIARISPVLSDGALGRPVYSEIWSRGWDELEIFELNGQPHLLRYKTGDASAEGEGKGHLLIDRMNLQEDLTSMTFESLTNLPNTPINALPWSSFEGFELNGHSYLLRYGNARAGEVELVRLDVDRGTLSLTPVTDHMHWSRGWDEIEVFLHAGQPYVVMYKGGLSATDGESVSSAKVLRIVEAGGIPAFEPVYEGTWESGITHLRPFRYGGQTFVLAYSAINTKQNISYRALSANPAQWDVELLHPSWTDDWVGDTPWELIEVVQGNEASLP